MPDRGVPFALKATSDESPISSHFPVAAVHEQEVLHRVVRDEQVHQPVVVDVGRDDAERLAEDRWMSVPGRDVR
jgi:hypothetical protein